MSVQFLLLFLLLISIATGEFTRSCHNAVQCVFRPPGSGRVYLDCIDGTCACAKFERIANVAIWNLTEDLSRSPSCLIAEFGPCGKDNGLEIGCEPGLFCVDARCRSLNKIGTLTTGDVCFNHNDCARGLKCEGRGRSQQICQAEVEEQPEEDEEEEEETATEMPPRRYSIDDAVPVPSPSSSSSSPPEVHIVPVEKEEDDDEEDVWAGEHEIDLVAGEGQSNLAGGHERNSAEHERNSAGEHERNSAGEEESNSAGKDERNWAGEHERSSQTGGNNATQAEETGSSATKSSIQFLSLFVLVLSSLFVRH